MSASSQVWPRVVELLLAAVLVASGAVPAFAAEVHRFEIPAEGASAAIRDFGLQARVQILVAGENVKDKQLRAVSGELSTDEGLRLLLAGSGLTYQYVADRSIALLAQDNPSAAPLVSGPAKESPQPSLWDRFRLAQVDQATSSNTAAAEQDRTSERKPAQLDEVVVTGTRRAGVTVGESSTPVDVISADQITRQGFSDVNDMLRTTVPSFNVKTFSVESYSVAVRPFSLRGLSPDQTLVLVNGKRRHRSAIVQISRLPLASGAQGPDLSTIPSIAIDRVEVLRDGAAAQYGSDAIAGVINFQLKRAGEGGLINAKSGQYYQGDGENYEVQGNLGLPLSEKGFINISAEYARNKPTFRQIQRLNAALQIAAGNTAIADPAQPWGDPSSEGGRIFVNAEEPLADNVSAYEFANYSNTVVESTQFWRSPDPIGAFPNARLDIFRSVPLTNTPGGPRFSFASLFPGGILPVHHYRVEDLSVTGGVKGKLGGGLNYDVSGSLAKSTDKNNVLHTVNPSLGPTAPTNYYVGALEQRESQLHADFVYDWDVGVLAKPLNVAFGTEYRKETFELKAGDPDSYRAGPFARVWDPDKGRFIGLAVGSSAFPGYQPTQAGIWSRSNEALYLDLETDVVKRLSVGVAGRYEHFSDFGGTFNYKVSGRYALLSWLALRASYNTGFRAPTPGQSHISDRSTSVDLTTGSLLNRATVPVDSSVAAFYGAKDLKPERSKNYSLGTVIELPHGLLFTLDHFHIEIIDRIGVTSPIIITAADRTALTARGTDVSDLSTVAFFANAFGTKTLGFDAVLSKYWSVGGFNFDLGGAVNHTETTISTISDPRAIDRQRAIEIGSYYPNWRGTITGTVEHGPVSLLTRVSYYGTYTNAVPAVTATAFDQTHGSAILIDLDATYDVTKNVRLSLGGENVFNKYPDKERLAANINNGQIYTQNSPFGYNGGFWYLRGAVRF